MENSDNKKKKNSILPFLWLGGAGITGAAIVLALLYARKYGEANGLTQQLSDTTTVLMKEMDLLDKELALAALRYDSLTAAYQVLSTDLVRQKNKTTGLAKENKHLSGLERDCRNNNLALAATIDQMNAENKAMMGEMAGIQTQLNEQRVQVIYRDSVIAAQLALLGMQDEQMKSDSASLTRLMDSIRYENASGYFNSTELNGGYGLAKVDVPYSHYFFGLTTVNGFAVNRHLYTGIGIGLLNYDAGLTAPLYLDFRYHFSKTGFNPYLFTDCGLNFRFDNMGQPMVFFNPGIGFHKKLSEQFGLNLGAGIMMQRDEVRSSYANLKAGFVFRNDKRK
jgi:hypothetical protein